MTLEVAMPNSRRRVLALVASVAAATALVSCGAQSSQRGSVRTVKTGEPISQPLPPLSGPALPAGAQQSVAVRVSTNHQVATSNTNTTSHTAITKDVEVSSSQHVSTASTSASTSVSVSVSVHNSASHVVTSTSSSASTHSTTSHVEAVASQSRSVHVERSAGTGGPPPDVEGELAQHLADAQSAAAIEFP
jgi:hypothetical protein